MKLWFSLIIALAFIPAYCYSADWHYFVLDTGDYTSGNHGFDLDSNDYPHFVYYSWAYPILKHGYFDGAEWHYDTIPGAAGGYDPALTVDDEDRVHISYESGVQELSYCYWDGANWHQETVDGYDTGCTSSIAVDSNGYPHISYDHGVYGPDDISLKYAFKDGTGWHISIVDDQGEDQGVYSSIALDSEDHPHIAYEYLDNPYEYLKYAHYDGSQWDIEVVDYMGTDHFDCSIAVDSQDRPHIAYTNKHDLLWYALKDNGIWSIEEIGVCGGDASLALDGNEFPCIAYTDPNYIIKYIRWTGSTWQNEIAYDGNGWFGYFDTHLSLDSDDNPHISCNNELIDKIYYIWYGDPLGVEEDDDTPATPNTFSLSPAYPNPSSGSAIIGFALPRACAVNLEVFDIKGRKVAALAEGALPAGEHQREVSGLSSGVYLYRLTADEFAETKKMVVK